MESNSPSTEDEEMPKKIGDSRSLTLHIISDPDQSENVNAAFQYLISRLDLSLGVISVSERFKPLNPKPIQEDLETLHLPSLAVVLFFKDDFNIDAPHDKSTLAGKILNDVRIFLCQKPWRFHHKVEVTGKLISCESNLQEYYSYSPATNDVTNSNEQPENQIDSPVNTPMHFPLWAVRKVHYGKPIVRFTLFVNCTSWSDQINFYKLILRKEETTVRDDFCYFNTFESQNTCVQLALKKLPSGVKAQPLLSSILQFKVKNVGQLVPLLPNSCEPISELRWRTRDHDSNLILLQIRRTRDLNISSSFVKKIFSDQEYFGSKVANRKVRKTRAKSGSNNKLKTSTPKSNKQSDKPPSKNIESFDSNESKDREPLKSELLMESNIDSRNSPSMKNLSDSQNFKRAKKKAHFDEYKNNHSEKSKNSENLEHFNSNQVDSIKEPAKTTNFELHHHDLDEWNEDHSNPEKMSINEPAVYFQTNYNRSSPRTSSGSSRSTAGTSDYHTTRETSPENRTVDTKINVKSTKKEKLIYITKKCSSTCPVDATSDNDDSRTSLPKKAFPLSLSKDEGFYV